MILAFIGIQQCTLVIVRDNQIQDFMERNKCVDTSAVTDIYNFTKMSITSQSVPIFIPIVFAILGFGLIIYFVWKKRELQEFDDASEIKDPKRKRERDGSFSPTSST
jgi:hypothetical protein